jgi:hypothetical protein
VTTIAFMYNNRLQVCHPGNLLVRLNFSLDAVEYAACTTAQDNSVISHEPATRCACAIVANPSAIPLVRNIVGSVNQLACTE